MQLGTRTAIIQQMQYENPSNPEIWSGSTLNTLLQNIRRMETTGLRGPDIPLDENMLKHINVTTGTTRGSVSLLKMGRKQPWPLALFKDRFAENRQQIEDLLTVVTAQAEGSGFDPKSLQALIDAVNTLKQRIIDSVVDLTPTEYVLAMRYANQLSDAVWNLRDPNGANYLNGTWAARGNTVAELIDNMNRSVALTFAAATAGDEPSYSMLYQALLAYSHGLAWPSPSAGEGR
jgi:hypothetical protein